MAFRVQFSYSGFGPAEKAIGALTYFSSSGLMAQVGLNMERMIKRRIRSEKTSPDGRRWEPNKDGTSILFRTGGLYGSIKHRTTPFRAIVGTNWYPAHVHQFGMIITARRGYMVYKSGGQWHRSRRVRIPQRMFMGLSAANLAELRQVIDAHMSRWLPWR